MMRIMATCSKSLTRELVPILFPQILPRPKHYVGQLSHLFNEKPVSVVSTNNRVVRKYSYMHTNYGNVGEWATKNLKYDLKVFSVLNPPCVSDSLTPWLCMVAGLT